MTLDNDLLKRSLEAISDELTRKDAEIKAYRDALRELEVAASRFGIVRSRRVRGDDVLAETDRLLGALRDARKVLSDGTEG